MLSDILALSRAKFEEDTRYLSDLFGTVEHMEGCIVRLKGNIGLENYKQSFQNPSEERTLTVTSIHDTVLFFKHIIKNMPEFDILDGITVTGTFSFTKGYRVEQMRRPAKLPSYLESCIVDKISNALSQLTVKSSFFDKNYKKGGMISLACVKQHSEWHNKYLQDVESRFVNMCKSCGSKAIKGCCSNYSVNNRKKLKMIIGWHAP